MGKRRERALESSQLKKSVFLSPMTEADLPQVMVIEQHTFLSAWKEETFREEILPTDGFFAYTAKRHVQGIPGRELLGYIVFWDMMQYVHIANIAVAESYRGRHIGKKLMAISMQYTLNNSRNIILLEVRASNDAAQQFYIDLGFEKAAVKRGYYQKENEDAFVMALRLHSSRRKHQMVERVQSILADTTLVETPLGNTSPGDSQ